MHMLRPTALVWMASFIFGLFSAAVGHGQVAGNSGGSGPTPWNDPNNTALADKIADGLAQGNFDGAASADGDYGGFDVVGELPDLNRMPSINEGYAQCFPAMVGRVLGYLGNVNDPNGTADFGAQDFANELLRELGGWVSHEPRNKRTPHRPGGGGDPLPPLEPLNDCGDGGEDEEPGPLVGPAEGGGGGAEQGPGGTAGGSVTTPPPGPFGGLGGTFFGTMIPGKLAKLKTMGPPWDKVQTKVWKKKKEQWGQEGFSSFSDMMDKMAEQLAAGTPVEVHLEGGAGATTGRHATVVGKILKFRSTGHYGLVFVEDKKQGDNQASNYLRGPYIFDKDTGACLNSPGMTILEIFTEGWG